MMIDEFKKFVKLVLHPETKILYATFHHNYEECEDSDIESTANRWYQERYARDEVPDDCINDCVTDNLITVTLCVEEILDEVLDEEDNLNETMTIKKRRK